MKEKVLYIVLGFSLGLNLSLGGALFLGRMKDQNGPPAIVQPGQPGAALPPAIQRKLENARRPWMPEFNRVWGEVQQARQGLYESLREQPPDPRKIRERLDRVGELQKTHQAMVVDRILQETESMNPDERRDYLEWIGRGLQCPVMGPGWGSKKCRRGSCAPGGAEP
jgi:uncharacterized membrane protein